MYSAIIAKIEEVQPIEWRDRIQKAKVCWSWVIVSMDQVVWSLGVYFPVDGCISKEYGEVNNLFRKKDSDGKNIGWYFEENGRVKCLKFQGVKSDGLFMPWNSLDYTGMSTYTVGDLITEFNWHLICYKWVNPETAQQASQSKKMRGETDMFKKHIDTEQLMLHLNDLEEGDLLIVTHKLHGTSQRVGYVKEHKPWLFSKILRRLGISTDKWEYLVGSRNVIISDDKPDGWYSNEFRERAAKPFIDKLHKWEVVYYEVVGWDNVFSPIMWAVSIDQLDDSAKNQYKNNIWMITQDKLIYSYKLEPGEMDVYVYRIALVNEDWHMVDYSYDDMKNRCAQLGVKHVPEFERFFFDWDRRALAEKIVGRYEDNYDPIDETHPLEGIVIRKEWGLKPAFFKRKTYDFKLLEGIIKTKKDYIDLEEAS